jgi:hypothetical protein
MARSAIYDSAWDTRQRRLASAGLLRDMLRRTPWHDANWVVDHIERRADARRPFDADWVEVTLGQIRAIWRGIDADFRSRHSGRLPPTFEPYLEIYGGLQHVLGSQTATAGLTGLLMAYYRHLEALTRLGHLPECKPEYNRYVFQQAQASLTLDEFRPRTTREIPWVWQRPGGFSRWDPAWRDWNGGTVRKLAQAIHDERRFADLPVLADALEEAGCNDESALSHCRDPGARHCLGCWVVDHLLAQALHFAEVERPVNKLFVLPLMQKEEVPAP